MLLEYQLDWIKIVDFLLIAKFLSIPDNYDLPALLYYSRWFMDNEIVPGNHGTTLKLKKVSREYNNKIVKCEVNNVIGKSEETETLDIHCKYSKMVFLC